MRKKSKEHEGLNEDMQNLLSYIGELVDELAVDDNVGYSELMDLYEWLEKIMVFHYDIFTN